MFSSKMVFFNARNSSTPPTTTTPAPANWIVAGSEIGIGHSWDSGFKGTSISNTPLEKGMVGIWGTQDPRYLYVFEGTEYYTVDIPVNPVPTQTNNPLNGFRPNIIIQAKRTLSGVVMINGGNNTTSPGNLWAPRFFTWKPDPDQPDPEYTLGTLSSDSFPNSFLQPTIGFSSAAASDRRFLYSCKMLPSATAELANRHVGYFSWNGWNWETCNLPGTELFTGQSTRKYKLFGFKDYFYALITTDDRGSEVNKLYRADASTSTLGAWQEFNIPSNPDRPEEQLEGGWRSFIQTGSSSTRYFLFGHGKKYAHSSNLSSWTIAEMPSPFADTWDKSASVGNTLVAIGRGNSAAVCNNTTAPSPTFIMETLNLGSQQDCFGLTHDGEIFIAMSEQNFSFRIPPN